MSVNIHEGQRSQIGKLKIFLKSKFKTEQLIENRCHGSMTQLYVVVLVEDTDL